MYKLYFEKLKRNVFNQYNIKYLLRVPFLICILISLFSHKAVSQTTIDFNSLVNFSGLGLAYTEGGFTFSINDPGGGRQITGRTGQGYLGSASLYDNNIVPEAITRWTIRKADNSAFQFRGIFLKDGGFGDVSGAITGYKNGNPTGTVSNVSFSRTATEPLDFSANPIFFDVDEIRITASDINFYLDHFTYGPPVGSTAPVVTAATAPTVNEDDEDVAVSGLSVTDDDGDNQTLTFTITGGTLSIGTTNITFGGSGNGSASFTAAGTLAAINTALSAATFTPTPNLFGTNAGGISVVANDGNANSTAASVTFDIIGVNDDPTITGLPATLAVGEDSTEDTFDISSATIGDIDAGGGNLSLILVANGGIFDIATSTGVTIHGLLTDSLTIIGNLTDLNNYIRQPSNIYFRPAANLSGVAAASVVVYLTDNGNTGSGGGDKLNKGSISINITPVNDAPIVANPIPNQEAAVAELWSFQFAGNTFTDADNDNLQYTAQLSDGSALPTWIEFTPSNRTFSGTPTAANVGVYTIKVIANDGNGEEIEDSFTLTVAVNSPKVVSVQSQSANGTYKIDDEVTLEVTFSQNVTVSGTPTLTMETGTVDTEAVYSGGSGTSTLSFIYTVVEGNIAPDLDYMSSAALALKGGTIKNSSGIDASLTLPSPGSSGSLGANAAIVIDGIRPNVITRNITIQLNATGNASITAADINNGSTDASGIASMTLDKSNFDCGNVGDNTVALTVTDANGNIKTATATVTVEDITTPVVVTRNITIQLDATGNASITSADIDNGSADACGIASMTLSQDSFDCGNVGDNTVTLTVTDISGNTSSATAIVTVEDITAPVVVTKNITVQLDATGNASITAADVDNGSSHPCTTISLRLSKSTFNRGNLGSNEVTLFASDTYGNESSATANVLVIAFEDVSYVYDGTDKLIQVQGQLPAGVTAVYNDNSRTDAGTQEVTATISGSNYNTLILTANLTVIKASQTITWNQQLNFSGCDNISEISLTATASSGLPVFYTVDNTTVADVIGNVLHIKQPGKVKVTVSQVGNSNYNAAQDLENEIFISKPGLIRQHWDDVLFLDNSSGNYVSYQWYQNGLPISGATKQYYSAGAPLSGTYHAEGITETGEKMISCPLEILASSFSNRMTIIPNPVSSGQLFTVKLDFDTASLNGANITMSDMSGRVLNTTQVNGSEVQLNAPSKQGIYIINLNFAGGNYKSLNLLVK